MSGSRRAPVAFTGTSVAPVKPARRRIPVNVAPAELALPPLQFRRPRYAIGHPEPGTGAYPRPLAGRGGQSPTGP